MMDTDLWPCVNRDTVFTQPIHFAPKLNKSPNLDAKIKFDFVASSLNGAYEEFAKYGLAPVTKEFHTLSKGPRMEVVHGENHVRLDWGLIELAAQRPRGALLEGKNSQHKSLVGPEPSSELKPSPLLPGDTKGIVNSCKPRRKKRMTSAKARQFSDRRLFKGGCQDKKKKKRGKRGKKGKVVEGKPVASFSTNYKEWQRRDADNRSQGQVASDANRDFDLNAKVGLGDEYVFFFCICKLSFYLR